MPLHPTAIPDAIAELTEEITRVLGTSELTALLDKAYKLACEEVERPELSDKWEFRQSHGERVPKWPL